MSSKTKKVQPTRQQILATAMLGIGAAIDGLSGGNNPHVVKVREQLNELEVKIATMIGDRQKAADAKQS
jgi:hypothetical protein